MKIVITGSSSGIGRALTENLLAQGHQVWGLARSDQSDFSASAGSFRSTQCDVSEWYEVEEAARIIVAEWPALDAIITCAAIQTAIGPAMEVSARQWAHTVHTNLDGTYFVLRALFAHLQPASGRSKLICFSGGGATKPRPNFSAYGVAKTGVVRLVETLAEEWRDQPVDINAIAPGAIPTRMTEQLVRVGPEAAGEVEHAEAVKRVSSEDPAALEKALGLVNFLLSSESDGISGRLISAPWDPWATLKLHRHALANSDVYTLRRIVPEERNLAFG